VIPTTLLRKLEFPTKSLLQAVSFNRFSHPLALASFLTEAKPTFINFPMAHHNLRRSKVMLSCLGGFSSKSNKCHKDCFTKRISLNPILDLSQITQTSQRGVGVSSQSHANEYVLWMAPTLFKGGRGRFYTCPPKTNR
jgi:hypothetical protein